MTGFGVSLWFARRLKSPFVYDGRDFPLPGQAGRVILASKLPGI